MVTAELIDPLEEMNAANSAGIAGIMNVAIGTDAAPAADPPAPAGAVGGNLGGLKNGMPGVSEDVPNAGAARRLHGNADRFPRSRPANIG